MTHRSRLVRFLAFALFGAIVFALVSCGGGDAPAGDASSGGSGGAAGGAPLAGKVTLSQQTLALSEGQSASLTGSVSPEDLPDRSLSWRSTREAVATVDKEGRVTAIGPGRAKILATSSDGNATGICVVTVEGSGESALAGVSLDRNTVGLSVGGTRTLRAVTLPGGGSEGITWESSDPAIAAVEGGVITGVSEGTVSVVARAAEGLPATCLVTVSAEAAGDHEKPAVDLTNAAEIEDLGGYNGVLRRKSGGEIVFSPTLDELRALAPGGDYSAYGAWLSFSTYDTGEDGRNGRSDGVPLIAWPAEPMVVSDPLFLDARAARGDWVDFFLQGEGIDCGFCPSSHTYYEVDFTVVEKSSPDKGLFHGVYTVMAGGDIEDSPYYNPTAGPASPALEGRKVEFAAEGSGGGIAGTAVQILPEGGRTSEVAAVPEDGFVFAGWSDGVSTPARGGESFEEDTVLLAKFTVSTAYSILPEVRITTASGLPVTTQTYEGATLSVSGADEPRYNLRDVPLQMRGRGNSSWNGGAAQTDYDSKNSYRLKFDEGLRFLGIGESKNRDWILQANKFDVAGLRNYLVWELSNRMGTLPYVPSCTWVQLFVNGDYRGMYMVTEHVEVANDRVEIDDSGAGPDKGYFLEFDFRGNYGDEPYFYIDGYGPEPRKDRHGAVEIVIKSAVEGDGAAEVKFLSDYLTRVHEAMLSGDRDAICELVDLPSFLDMFLIEELSKDCDTGAASCFYQKDPGGKLIATAPWDFDFGFGTYGPSVDPYGFVSSGESEGDGHSNPWYEALLEEEWFREAARARLEELSPALEEVLSVIEEKGEYLTADADLNAGRWDLYGRDYHQYIAPQASSELHSYADHMEYLIEWTKTRWEDMRELLQ